MKARESSFDVLVQISLQVRYYSKFGWKYAAEKILQRGNKKGELLLM